MHATAAIPSKTRLNVTLEDSQIAHLSLLGDPRSTDSACHISRERVLDYKLVRCDTKRCQEQLVPVQEALPTTAHHSMPTRGEITPTAYAPLFVIPTLLVVVPRCPARLRLPLFGGVVSVYGSFSLYKYFSSEG